MYSLKKIVRVLRVILGYFKATHCILFATHLLISPLPLSLLSILPLFLWTYEMIHVSSFCEIIV